MEATPTHSLRELIAHPERLDADSLPLLRQCVERYPYFQTARLLLLKNLYVLHDPTFEEELHRMVIYVGNRTFFYHFITGQPKDESGERNAATAPAEADNRTLALIDAFLSTMPEEAPRMLNTEVTTDYAACFLAGNSESQSLTDESGTDEEQATPMRGQELIDQFISQGADSIRPIKKEGEDYSEARGAEERKVEEEPEALTEIEDDDCFTETLAKIYIKQHRYAKALEIIKKLSLKYPKKTAYFADQIKNLEELIINTNSKK